LFEVRNISGTDIPLANTVIKRNETVVLDVPVSYLENAYNNGFIVYREVTTPIVKQKPAPKKRTRKKSK
jgi:hypothetical protein